MGRTKIMFFFDTEDFTSDRSSDAVYLLANLMREEGVTGHFAVVGLLADRLVKSGRTDVLDVLKGHIIGTHTYGHSLHPDICEQSDFEDFAEAYRNVAEYEDEAIGMIERATGVEAPLFACPPGNSKSYVAMYYYAGRGIPFYCDTVAEDLRGSELYYCGQRHIGYMRSLEGMFLGSDPLDFDTGVPRLLDEWAEGRDTVIVYTHPNMTVKTEFWDKLNYNKGNLSELGNWIEAPDRTAGETAAFLADIRRFVRAIKADGRFELTNLNELLAAQPERHRVTRADIPAILEKLKCDFAPIEEPSLSISDVFCACVALLRGEDGYTPGVTRGFLETPAGISAPVTVTREDVAAAAEHIDIADFLPPTIPVGSVRLGAADFLFAMLGLLAADASTVEVTPRPQLNEIADLPKLCSFHLKDTWVHLPTLEDSWLSDRLRLQVWTRR